MAAEENMPSSDRGPSPKKRRKAWMVGGIAVAVVVVLGVGLFVWHEQPSFCAAICHEPMDEYLATYDQQPNTTGIDKWGNEVANTSALLAVTHNAANTTCMDCHVPTLDEQVSEGSAWLAGDYEAPLHERSATELVQARELENANEFCLNDSCHSMEDVLTKTQGMERNPHLFVHETQECAECHKAHRASVNTCTECHDDAEVPAGWLTMQENRELVAASNGR